MLEEFECNLGFSRSQKFRPVKMVESLVQTRYQKSMHVVAQREGSSRRVLAWELLAHRASLYIAILWRNYMEIYCCSIFLRLPSCIAVSNSHPTVAGLLLNEEVAGIIMQDRRSPHKLNNHVMSQTKLKQGPSS